MKQVVVTLVAVAVLAAAGAILSGQTNQTGQTEGFTFNAPAPVTPGTDSRTQPQQSPAFDPFSSGTPETAPDNAFFSDSQPAQNPFVDQLATLRSEYLSIAKARAELMTADELRLAIASAREETAALRAQRQLEEASRILAEIVELHPQTEAAQRARRAHSLLQSGPDGGDAASELREEPEVFDARDEQLEQPLLPGSADQNDLLPEPSAPIDDVPDSSTFDQEQLVPFPRSEPEAIPEPGPVDRLERGDLVPQPRPETNGSELR